MKVLPINIQNSSQANKQSINNITFKGSVDKSVYKYLDKICPETTAMKNEIITALKTFMAPLHKDTTFSIVNVPAVRTYILPFPVDRLSVGRVPVDVGDYQTFFSNKKTKTAFSLSERNTRIAGKDESYHSPKECEWCHWQGDKLVAFKSHVDAVIEFFKDKDFDVDNVLYNKRLTKKTLSDYLLPKFIVLRKYKNLAPEFQKFHTNSDVCIYNYALP